MAAFNGRPVRLDLRANVSRYAERRKSGLTGAPNVAQLEDLAHNTFRLWLRT